MTTPADELRTAAERLRKLAGQATEAPWSTAWNGQEYELRSPDEAAYPIAEWTYAIATLEPEASEQRAECDTADADYIAAMHPGVGEALAAWLDSWTGIDLYEAGALPEDARHALAVARAINGGAP